MKLDKATSTSQGEVHLNLESWEIGEEREVLWPVGEPLAQESWLGSSSHLGGGSWVEVNLQRGRKLGPWEKCWRASRFSPIQ